MSPLLSVCIWRSIHGGAIPREKAVTRSTTRTGEAFGGIMAVGKDKYFFADIAKRHGWDSKIITSIAKDAGIASYNKTYRKNKRCNSRERYLSGEELETLEGFIKNPEYIQGESSLWFKYYGVPPYVRLT